MANGKNMQRVKDMLDGTYGRKIVIGDHSVGRGVKDRKIGDVWTDSEGTKWEQKNGYKMKVSTLKRGIAAECKDCGKYCTNRRDKNVHKKMDRCFSCQLTFEQKLNLYPIKLWAWMRYMELSRMDSIDKEMEQAVFDNHEQNKKNPFDEKIANALANAEVDKTFKINKNLTGG